MNKQDYRKIEYTVKETFKLKNNEITTYKLKGYKNVYVSNTCHIKPKGLHIILKNVNEAIREFEIDDKIFKIVVLSYKDGMDTYGKYNAISNEIIFNEVICDKSKLAVEKIAIGHVERHEVWHLKQANNYRKQHGIINEKNYSDYLKYTNRRGILTL